MTESTSAQHRAKKSTWQRLHGEWSWEKYIPGVLGLVCIGDAVVTSDGMRELIRNGALQTGLILIVGAYVSELRYRLLKDVRND